jgi:hypothetical protein
MTHPEMTRRSLLVATISGLTIPALAALAPPTLSLALPAIASGSTKTCPCKRSGAAAIPANDPAWRPLFGMKGLTPKLSASGLAYFCSGEEDYWTTIALKTAASLASAAIGFACPQCGVIAQAVDIGSSLLLKEPGASKYATAFGDDPKNSSGLGSKKCGGMICSLGSPKPKTGSCACSSSNVYHLVKNAQTRFGKYWKDHKCLTLPELQSKVKLQKSGTLYAMAWDQTGGHGDNRGTYGLAWRV